MEQLRAIIAANVSRLRLERGLTQQELANQLNYSDKAVSKWERGESVPDISVLARIAAIFLSSGTPAASAKYGEPGASALTTKNDMLAIKGLKPGVTNITGTAQDGSGKKIKISVTVRGDVTAMTLDENVTVKAGGSYTLTPEFTINGVTSANPKLYKSYMKYTDTKVSYWSSSEDVTVSAKGKITVKKGTSVRSATITAFTADGNDVKKRIVNVTIQ